MFLKLTCNGEPISVNMDKVFDFHPALDERGTMLHFDLSVPFTPVPFTPGNGPSLRTHHKKQVDEPYEAICKLLAGATK